MITLLLGLGALLLLAGGGGNNSSKREDGGMLPGGAELLDPDVDFLADTIGWPYSWGGGGPDTAWKDGALGVDCSGYALMVAVELGQVDPSIGRLRAVDIANMCDPVPAGEQQPGDFAVYPNHIMVVASYPDADGHSAVIGASGGGPDTHGDDPNAHVKVFPSERYRRDFLTFARWKEAA